MSFTYSIVQRWLGLEIATLVLASPFPLFAQELSGQRTLPGHARCVSSIAFTPKGEKLIAGDVSGDIVIWDLQSGKSLTKLRDGGVDGVLTSFALSPDGKRLGAAMAYSKRPRIILWDLTNHTAIGTIGDHSGEPPLGNVLSIDFDSAGKSLAFGNDAGKVMLVDVSLIGPVEGPKQLNLPVILWITYPLGVVLMVVCSLASRRKTVPVGSGLILLLVTFFVRIERLSPDQYAPIVVLGEHHGPVRAVRFSVDGRTVISAGGQSIVVWDLAARDHRTVIKDDDGVCALAMNPRGSTMLSGGPDMTLKSRSVSNAHDKPILVLQLQARERPGRSSVVSAAYSRDGKVFAAACETGEMIVGDAIDPKVILTERLNPARCVAFSPDGKTIAIGGSSGHGFTGQVTLFDFAETKKE